MVTKISNGENNGKSASKGGSVLIVTVAIFGSGRNGLTKFVWSCQNLDKICLCQIFNLIIVGALKNLFFRSCRANCKICTVPPLTKICLALRQDEGVSEVW